MTPRPLFILKLMLVLGLIMAVPLSAQAVVGNEVQKGEAQDQAILAGFAPHKALYEIKLAAIHGGSQILNISGQMFYEWKPACDAWASNHRFNIVYEYTDSGPMNITSVFSTYEPFDGKTLNFTSERKRDGRVFEELRGQATLDADQSGVAKFTLPDGLNFELPAGTLFPMGHSLDIARKIKEGKKLYTATIFDGSDEEGPVEVNAFIGKPVEKMIPAADNQAIDAKLLASPATNVRLAFFPLNNPESSPDYEMNLVFHENGIISDMLIEYEDFTISQKLVALEPVSGGCEAGNPPSAK